MLGLSPVERGVIPSAGQAQCPLHSQALWGRKPSGSVLALLGALGPLGWWGMF